MYTTETQQALDREQVYEMLTKENEYAKGWGEGKEAIHPGFPDHMVCRSTGQPFGMFDFLVFTEKYLEEAKLAYANYTPDLGAIRIRFLKAASLLVTALQVHGEPGDLERLAGVSSSKFPILHGGLKVLKDQTTE
jgi:hypothetical protein